jgi:hypothetical protein
MVGSPYVVLRGIPFFFLNKFVGDEGWRYTHFHLWGTSYVVPVKRENENFYKILSFIKTAS